MRLMIKLQDKDAKKILIIAMIVFALKFMIAASGAGFARSSVPRRTLGFASNRRAKVAAQGMRNTHSKRPSVVIFWKGRPKPASRHR